MNILVGADPELFVQDKGGKVVNAEGMVQGTKQEPFPVDSGAVQVDGMALEFNISPAMTAEEFKGNILKVKQSLHEMIGINKYELLASPSVLFDQDVMDKASYIAKQLGCEPDFNAWAFGEVNPAPDGSTNMRTGAGHVHLGWTSDEDVYDPSHVEACIDLTKQLDCSLGLQSLHWDDDDRRRELYGKAGAFRPKEYGVEYRVLSNAWLRSEALVSHVYQVAVKSTQDFLKGIHYYDDVQACDLINSGDRKAANEAAEMLQGKYGVPMLGA